MLEVEKGSTRSHSLEKSLWKKVWTFRKTDYGMMTTTTTTVLSRTQLLIICVGRIFIKPASLVGLIIAGRFLNLNSRKK
jgi:hypothetical protein